MEVHKKIKMVKNDPNWGNLNSKKSNLLELGKSRFRSRPKKYLVGRKCPAYREKILDAY
jgi:hypothetical protein